MKAFKETLGGAGSFAAQSVQRPDRPESPASDKPPGEPAAPKPGWMPDLQPTDFDNSAGASDGPAPDDPASGGHDPIAAWLASGGQDDAAIAGRLQSNPGQSSINIL